MVRQSSSHKNIDISGLLKPLGAHPHSCPYRNFGSTGPTSPRLGKTQGAAAMAQPRRRRGLRGPADAVVAAYARSDLFAKRRSLTEEWEAWCVGYLAPATDQERLLNGG